MSPNPNETAGSQSSRFDQQSSPSNPFKAHGELMAAQFDKNYRSIQIKHKQPAQDYQLKQNSLNFQVSPRQAHRADQPPMENIETTSIKSLTQANQVRSTQNESLHGYYKKEKAIA